MNASSRLPAGCFRPVVVVDLEPALPQVRPKAGPPSEIAENPTRPAAPLSGQPSSRLSVSGDQPSSPRRRRSSSSSFAFSSIGRMRART